MEGLSLMTSTSDLVKAIEVADALQQSSLRTFIPAACLPIIAAAIREAREEGYAVGLEDGNSEAFATFQAVADATFGIETYSCDETEDFIRTVMEYAEVDAKETARNAALEEAAGVTAMFDDSGQGQYSDGLFAAAEIIKAHILALKDKPEESPSE
jgi:hypothetical protein